MVPPGTPKRKRGNVLRQYPLLTRRVSICVGFRSKWRCPIRNGAEIKMGFLKLIRARDADRILRDRPGRPTVNSQGSVQWRSHARSPWNQSRKNQQALEGRRRAFCRPSRAFFLWGTHPQGFRPGLLTDGLPGLLFQNDVKTVIVNDRGSPV